MDGTRILYVRECQRLDAPTTVWRPGLGEVTFDDSIDVIDQSTDGKFWESDESHPEQTVIKLVELRRNVDESHAFIMRKGNAVERQALVRERLGSW